MDPNDQKPEEFEDFDWIEKFSSKSIKIPFGSGISRKILGDELCEEFRKRTEDLILDSLSTNGKLSYKSSIQGGFPGSLAVAILRTNLPDLQQGNYKVLFKTDGQRFFLCFVTLKSKEGKEEYLCYAINRSNEYFILSVHGLSPNVYEGTILDGELVETEKGDFQFQVFDCVLSCGKPTIQLGHKDRLKLAKDCLQTLSTNSDFHKKNPFVLFCKEYASVEEIIEWGIEKKQSYDIDGLILVDSTRQYVFGKDVRLWKWKNVYTVDFYVEIKRTSENSQQNLEFYLFTFQKGNKRKLQLKGIPPPDWLSFFQDKNHQYVKSDLTSMDGMLVECIWKNEKWYPYRIRTDKSFANNEETYQLTLQNIQENIQFREIMKSFGI